MSDMKPFMPGFFTDLSVPLDHVRLAGSRCNACGVALFGQRESCENCGSRDMTDIAYGKTGKVYTYTIQRTPPPPPYSYGPAAESWVPRPVAWIDMPEGCRLLGYIDCPPEKVSIGMDVELLIEKGWKDEAGCDIIAYKFRLAGEAAG